MFQFVEWFWCADFMHGKRPLPNMYNCQEKVVGGVGFGGSFCSFLLFLSVESSFRLLVNDFQVSAANF